MGAILAGTEQIEQGALQRIATAEIKAAEAEADALTARDKAEAAERARRAAVRAEREARAAQSQAGDREDRARADLVRVQRESGERVTAAERARGRAESNLALLFANQPGRWTRSKVLLPPSPHVVAFRPHRPRSGRTHDVDRRARSAAWTRAAMCGTRS
ncbi:hypothetical protein AB0J43_59805 [Nonomuraea fuscirosea]